MTPWIERLAARAGIAGELLRFLWQAKRWWLVPMVIMLLLISVLLVVQQSALAPFIYTLF
jgi:drug/metabolite transporter superfamily protein YnfA